MAELSAAGVLHLAGLAHLNHGLRGEASDRDAEFCARLADDCGVPFDVERCDVAAIAARPRPFARGGGARGALRVSRACPPAAAADVVAVGHTRDDQAETVLLRLVRGAGSRGLRGIHPRRSTSSARSSTCAGRRSWRTSKATGARWVESTTATRTARAGGTASGTTCCRPLVASEGDSVVDVLARTAEIAGADEALLAALAPRRVPGSSWTDADGAAAGPGGAGAGAAGAAAPRPAWAWLQAVRPGAVVRRRSRRAAVL